MYVSKKLLTLLVLFAAVTVTVSTGAFSSAAADRGAEVVTASDLDGAYLGLTPSEGPNGAFAGDADGDGTLELAFDGGAAGVLGTGPNPDAVTTVDRVFDVTNRGTGDVDVWIDDGGVDAVTFSTAEADHGTLEGSANAYTLSPGESVPVGLVIDAGGEDAGVALLETVTAHAAASG